MPLTQEQAAQAIKDAGLQPWQATAAEDPNDPTSVLVTPHEDATTPSSSLGTFARNLGAGAPGSIGSALAISAASPLIAAGTAIGGAAGAMTGPLAEVGVPVGGVIGGAVPAIAAGAIGGGIGDAVGAPLKRALLGSEDQQARDQAEHGTAANMGRILANLAGFKKPGMSLLTGAYKSIPGLSKAALSVAEKESLKAAAVNAGVGGVVDAGEQLYNKGTIDPKQSLEAAAESAPFGAPRNIVGGIKARFTGKPAAQAAPPVMGDPEPAPLTPREVEKMANLREASQLERGTATPDDLKMAEQQLKYQSLQDWTEQQRLEERGRQINMTGKPVDRPQIPPTPEPNEVAPPNFVRPAEGSPVQSPRRPHIFKAGEPIGTPPAVNNPYDAPTPEPAQVIAESLRITADPAAGKQASFIPAGSPPVEIPANLRTIQHPKGTVVYNPEKITEQQAFASVEGDQIKGRALGLSQDVKPPAGNNVAVVSDSRGQPAVLTEVVPRDPAAIARAQRTQQIAAPGSTQRVTTPEEVVQTRAEQQDNPFMQEGPVAQRNPNVPNTRGPISPDSAAIAEQRRLVAEGSPLVDPAAVPVPPAEQLSRQSDAWLQTLEGLKVDLGPGQLNDITRVVPGVVWNAGIDVAKLAIKAGRSVADAITAAIEHMRSRGAKFDEREMRQRLEDRLSGAGIDVAPPKPENTAPVPLVAHEGPRGAGTKYVPDKIAHQVNSLLYDTHAKAPVVGDALAGYLTEARSLEGEANAPLDPVRASPKVANAVRAKRLEAMQSGLAPRFTPEERAVNTAIDTWAQHTRDTANARGKDIQQTPFYMPEMIDSALGNRYEHNSEQFLAETTPRFVKYQQEIAAKQGRELSAHEALQAAQYWKDHWTNAAKVKFLPSAVQGDFGALTKDARQFHLPPEFQDPDALRSLDRYNKRYATQLAREQWIDSQPDVVARLQLGDMADVNHLLKGDLGSVNKSMASPLIGSTQRFANSMVMQLPSAIWQSIQKLPDHLIHGHDVPLLWNATVKTARDFAAQREAAVKAGIVKPGHDYTVGENQTSLSDRLARNMDAASTWLRQHSGAGWIENANRVHDFTIGQALAEQAMAGENPAFLAKFNEGAHRGLTPEQNRDRMAANYAESIQGTYSAKGLPAWMLKGSTPAQVMRIQRFGVENALRTVQYTIEPALKGNYGPLVSYLMAGMVAAPVIKKIHEVLGGLPGAARDAAQGKEVTGTRLWQGKQSSMPTMREIDVATSDSSTGRSRDLEYALNAMSMADLAGTYGFMGKAAGIIANNVRGQSSGVVSDPGATLALTALKNFGAAGEAIRQGEPAVESILEAAKRTMLDNMQMTRGLTRDAGEQQDTRDKAVFAYLSGRKNTTIPQMVMNGLAGDTLSGNVKGITPLEDAARQGDRAAFEQLPYEKKMRLLNYPGAYATADAEIPHQSFMEQTKGPEAVQEYLKRQRAYRSRVLQALPADNPSSN